MSGFVTIPPPDAMLSSVQSLPPPGRAFPRDTDTLMAQLFSVKADVLTAVRQFILNLVNVEADPTLTTELLPDWEADFGLPDPCTVANPSTDQRRASLLAKIASQGGQSPEYFISVAAGRLASSSRSPGSSRSRWAGRSWATLCAARVGGSFGR